MVKHTQAIRRQFADKLSVFDYFVKMALKGLSLTLWQFFDIFRWFWEAGNNFN